MELVPFFQFYKDSQAIRFCEIFILLTHNFLGLSDLHMNRAGSLIKVHTVNAKIQETSDTEIVGGCEG